MDHREAWQEIAERRRVIIDKQTEEIATLKTKLAMRDQQLRELDAALTAEKAKVDIQRMALAERLGSTEPETAPEPWEAIVTAAIRWRRGADRGELAAAVDAFTGERAPSDPFAAAERFVREQTQTAALRPEQYADGAGAQAWRQAMGGE